MLNLPVAVNFGFVLSVSVAHYPLSLVVIIADVVVVGWRVDRKLYNGR